MSSSKLWDPKEGNFYGEKMPARFWPFLSPLLPFTVLSHTSSRNWPQLMYHGLLCNTTL